MQRPLDGFRVVDLTSVVMGPLGTQVLADLGADVIAIEGRRGDPNRSMSNTPHPDFSGPSLNLMRNKRSVGLDVRVPDGYDALCRLVASADVFVTNLRPASRARARLTYADLIRHRADLVYCAAAGFPSGSPDEDLPAYDDVIQARGGVVDLMERAGLPPVLMPTIFVDKAAGLVIANAVLAALLQRSLTGGGAEITIAMSEVLEAFLLVEHGASAMLEPPGSPPGYSRVLNPYRRPQATADGWIFVMPYEPHHFESLFRIGGRPELIGDERFATHRTRLEHGVEVAQAVASVVATRTTAEWLEVLPPIGVPCATIGTLDDLVAALPLAVHPDVGAYRVTPSLAGYGAGTGADVVRRPAPRRGEHGREVLAEIGYTDDAIDALERDGTLHRGDH